MKVSVICPTHDRPAMLRRAIAGVLAQEHADLELLVIADGSTEGTLEAVAQARRDDARVRLLEVRRQGNPAPLRDLALAAADGGAIAYVDDDDEWLPEHLGSLLAACDERHPVVVSGAEYRSGDGELLRRVRGPQLAWHPEIAVADPYTEPSRVLHLRGVPERAGGWRDLGVGLEDWDLWWRLTAAGIAFQPVDRVTTRLTVSETTRRHGVPCAYFLPVHEVGGEAQAADLAHAMCGAPQERLREATLADLQAWGDDLLADRLTVWPCGGAQPAGRRWADALAQTATGVAELAPAKLWGRWHVAIPLWCADAAHSRAAERVLRRRQPRQLQILGDLAAAADRSSHLTNERIPA